MIHEDICEGNNSILVRLLIASWRKGLNEVTKLDGNNWTTLNKYGDQMKLIHVHTLYVVGTDSDL